MHVVALALAGASACASARATHADRAAGVVVLSWNIHAGKDADRADNLERVAATIRESGADVVLLQEVDRETERSGRVDQLAVLERLTGLRGRFGRTLDYQGGGFGIAVLSRWPIVRDSMVPLIIEPPSVRAGGSREPRGVLHVVIDAPGGSLHVLNTHLDAEREDSARRQEVAQVAAFARRLRDAGATIIAGGDFNAEPGTPVIDAMLDAGFTDLWSACGAGAGLTYPARGGIKRIDYLFARDGVRCRQASVVGGDASDHRGLRVLIQR